MPQYPGCQKETIVSGNITTTRYIKNGKLIATKELEHNADGVRLSMRWRDANGRLHLESKKPAVVIHDTAYYTYWHGLPHS